MYSFIIISGVAVFYLFFKVMFDNGCKNQETIDEKLEKYDKERYDTLYELKETKSQLYSLKNKKKDLDDKIILILTNKILTFHKKYKKFNNDSIKKINQIIEQYTYNNDYMVNKIYQNIDGYIDVQELKKFSDNIDSDESDDSDYNINDDILSPSSEDDDDTEIKNDSKDNNIP